MGAVNFYHIEVGKNAKDAFQKAVEQAQYDHGHSGYTGTIAEKSSFVMIPLPDGMKPMELADKLMEEDDPRINDKWGDAGCIAIPNTDEYLFFGWASE